METDGQREARLAQKDSEPDGPHSLLNASNIDSESRHPKPAGTTGFSRCARGLSPLLLLTMRLIVFGALLLSVAIAQYWPSPLIQTTRGLVSFIAWAFALFGADRTSVLLSLVLVALGTGIFAWLGTQPLTALVSFGENTGILMIMVLVPLVGIVIDRGGYVEALGEIAEDIRHPAYLYGVALVLVYTTGSVLLNASIALVWTVLAPIAVRLGKRPDDVLVPSLPRGYNASLLWTPASPAMGTALLLTGASWTPVAKAGFVISLLMLSLAILVETGGPALSPGKGRDTVRPPAAHRSRPTAWRKTLVLALGLASFIVGVVILQEFGLSVFQAIIPCIVLTLVIWGGLIGKSDEVWKSVHQYFSTKLPGLSSQFLLMTTAGLIGTALQSALKNGLPGVSLTVQPDTLVFTLVASLLVWVISIAGIHSLIGMTIVHSVIAPFAGGVSPVHISLTLLLGAALGFSVSPVSATILVTSAVAGKNSIDAGFRRQWKYATVCWAVCSVVLTLLRI